MMLYLLIPCSVTVTTFKYYMTVPAGELTALPQTPVFKGPTSKGREGKGKGRGDGKRRGREREGRGREGNRTTQNLVTTPLAHPEFQAQFYMFALNLFWGGTPSLLGCALLILGQSVVRVKI